MKIKVLLAKYLAWVILAVLAAVLIYAAVSAFSADTSFDKMKEEIGKYEVIVKRGMAETTAPPQTPHDYIGELKDRFEHLAVIDRYRHNPFVVSQVVTWQVIQVAVGQTREVKVPFVRFTDVISPGDPYVNVHTEWKPEKEIGLVIIKALEPGEAAVAVVTQDNVEYHFPVSVLKVAQAPEPLPPYGVHIAGHAKRENHVKEPPLVLITFLPDNRRTESGPGQERSGPSNFANIYRKPAGAGDAEYGLPKRIAPAAPADVENVWQRFYPPEEVAHEPAPPPAPAAGAEPPAPMPAPNLTPGAPGGQERAGPPRPSQGAFVYLDDTVDDGESYVYKIETLNVQEELRTSACPQPYVLAPFTVPSFVEFDVKSVGIGRAVLSLSRPEPETGRIIVKDFTVAPGMKIGGVAGVPLTKDGRVRYKNVDFSTNCILVDTLASFGDILYGPVRTANETLVFSVRHALARDPSILYLTPRDSLRLKSKSESKQVVPRPEERGPAAPPPGRPPPP